MIHCGLCNKQVKDGEWEKHVASKEHQESLKNPQLRMQRYLEHQEEQARRMAGEG
jgi:hypothetical protein